MMIMPTLSINQERWQKAGRTTDHETFSNVFSSQTFSHLKQKKNFLNQNIVHSFTLIHTKMSSTYSCYFIFTHTYRCYFSLKHTERTLRNKLCKIFLQGSGGVSNFCSLSISAVVSATILVLRVMKTSLSGC